MFYRLPVSMSWHLPVCVAMLCVLSCGPLTANAQTQESEQLAQAKARIAELEKEVRVLQAKLTLLETQMKNQAQAASVQAPAVASTDAPATDATATVPNTPATTVHTPPPERATPVRKFQSLLQPMQLLPVNLRPKREVGWDRYGEDAANLWFSQQIPGNYIEAKFTIRSSPSTTRKKLVDGKYIYNHNIRVSFTTTNFNYAGVEFKPVSYVEYIDVGPELAKAYEKLDPNIPLRVTARISKYLVSRPTRINGLGTIHWEMQDWKIHSPHLPD